MSATDHACQIKVRFKGQRRFAFLGAGGRTTTKRMHGILVDDREKAIKAARDLLTDNAADVAAVAVMQGDRRIFHKGEDTPAAPVYGPEGGYRYLVGQERGRPVFHVTNDAGNYSALTIPVYELCSAEADRAGFKGERMIVHAATCLFSTSGVTFRQTDSTGRVW